jgi:hypothetical protein
LDCCDTFKQPGRGETYVISWAETVRLNRADIPKSTLNPLSVTLNATCNRATITVVPLPRCNHISPKPRSPLPVPINTISQSDIPASVICLWSAMSNSSSIRSFLGHCLDAEVYRLRKFNSLSLGRAREQRSLDHTSAMQYYDSSRRTS